MKHRLSCEFNIDTAGVELKYSDGSMISIDCTAVENQVETILGMNKGGFLLRRVSIETRRQRVEKVFFGTLTDWEKGPKSSKRRSSAYIGYGRAAFVQKGKSLAQQAFAGIISDAAVNY